MIGSNKNTARNKSHKTASKSRVVIKTKKSGGTKSNDNTSSTKAMEKSNNVIKVNKKSNQIITDLEGALVLTTKALNQVGGYKRHSKFY